MIEDKKIKKKLTHNLKEMETMYKLGESTMISTPPSRKRLKHVINISLNKNPSTIADFYSSAKNLASEEKLLGECSIINASMTTLHNAIGTRLSSMLDATEK